MGKASARLQLYKQGHGATLLAAGSWPYISLTTHMRTVAILQTGSAFYITVSGASGCSALRATALNTGT